MRFALFAAIGRQLLRTMVWTPSVSLILREKALTWSYILPQRGLCGQRRVLRRILVRPHYATDSIRKGFASQLIYKPGNETRTREEWDFVSRIANPFASPLADSYLTIVSEAQKQIGVNRAAPLLENTIMGLRSDTRSRARVAAPLAAVSL